MRVYRLSWLRRLRGRWSNFCYLAGAAGFTSVYRILGLIVGAGLVPARCVREVNNVRLQLIA